MGWFRRTPNTNGRHEQTADGDRDLGSGCCAEPWSSRGHEPVLEHDRDLAERLARGEPGAWQQLCETYGEALFMYDHHRTGGDPFAAEDIRQETLLAAAEAIRGYRREVPLFAWLCGIARHKVADEGRRRSRQGLPFAGLEDDSRPERAAFLGHASASGSVGSMLGSEPLPEEAFERAETRAAVVEALWSLPAEYREALVSRYVRKESVEAVAARLGRSYKAAESLLSRAREAFKRRLSEVERGEQ